MPSPHGGLDKNYNTCVRSLSRLELPVRTPMTLIYSSTRFPDVEKQASVPDHREG